jgi:hypothetical protein
VQLSDALHHFLLVLHGFTTKLFLTCLFDMKETHEVRNNTGNKALEEMLITKGKSSLPSPTVKLHK